MILLLSRTVILKLQSGSLFPAINLNFGWDKTTTTLENYSPYLIPGLAQFATSQENYSPAPIWAYANSRTEKIALTGLPVCISIFLGFVTV